MGLDQNWLVKNGDEQQSIAYHRKFNALEGFMDDKWHEAGNTGEFNCELVKITDEAKASLAWIQFGIFDEGHREFPESQHVIL